MKFKKIVKTFGGPALFFVVVIVIWEFGTKFFNVPSYFIPAPSVIYGSFIKNATNLVPHFIVTLKEIVFGFLLAVVIGTLAGSIAANVYSLRGIIYSLAIFTKTTPIIAIAPIMVMWFGYGLATIVIVTMIIAFFPVFINTATGLLSADPDSIDLMRSMNATKMQFFLKLQFPNALPYYFAGLKLGISAATIGAIIGEYVAPKQGLGYSALMSLARIDIPQLFLVVAIIITVCGLGLFGLICLIEKLLIPWKEEETK